MNQLVSIIVPVYNEEKYLDKCLSTLLNQSYPNTEIIVVNDGSTDSSEAIAKKYPVKYLYQKHQGVAKAKNFGAKKTSGEILVFADSDIYYDQNYIKNLITPIIEGKTVGTYSKEMYVANPKNIWSQCYNLNIGLDIHRKVPIDFPDEFTGYKAILKNTFNNSGGFENVGYGEDLSLFPKIRMKSRSATGAISYHYNPDTLKEVFLTARWVGRGNTFTFLKSIIRILKYLFPISIIIGLYKSFKNKKLSFLIFKLVWDSGVLIGIVNSLFSKKHAK